MMPAYDDVKMPGMRLNLRLKKRSDFPLTREALSSTQARGPFACLTVSDTGNGLAAIYGIVR